MIIENNNSAQTVWPMSYELSYLAIIVSHNTISGSKDVIVYSELYVSPAWL